VLDRSRNRNCSPGEDGRFRLAVTGRERKSGCESPVLQAETQPGLPTLRQFQAAQGVIARRWLDTLL
jgi:hypothetical protein